MIIKQEKMQKKNEERLEHLKWSALFYHKHNCECKFNWREGHEQKGI